jgi:hypothetical protein
MNCANCKNPVSDNSTECEWCGSMINKQIPISDKQENIRKLKIVYNGRWMLFDNLKTDIYINNTFKSTESIKKGFKFEIQNTAILPTIKLKTGIYSKILKIPKLDLTKDYLIELYFSPLYGIFYSEPEKITEL